MIYENLALIVAIGNNREIGINNTLLTHLPNDLKRFKEITMGSTIIMGKTFQSLPIKPLPGRKNVVLSTNEFQRYAGCYMAYSIEMALHYCLSEPHVFVIGGAIIYKHFLPYCTTLYITKIHADFDNADAFFPQIDFSQWYLLEEICCKADEKHLYDYTFCTYKRILKK